MRPAYFTICARNYLAYALTLRNSVLQSSPQADFIIFLADAPLQEPVPDTHIIPIDALNLPNLREMAFRYSLMELATAIKPTCFKHLLTEMGYEQAVYLDPDIQLFAPLSRVDSAFADGASFVVTPHILAPLTDDKTPTDIDILRSGTFNLGFAAARKCDETLAFLDWWENRLYHHGYNDLERGLFVDQKFAELAPSFLPNLRILHDPGYNVAYWNLAHRPLSQTAEGWQAGGAPLVFFHFSGVVPGNPGIFSKHQTRFSIHDLGAAAQLVTDYLGQLEQNDQALWGSVPYAFDRLEDGTLIPHIVRRSPPETASPAEWWRAYDSAYWDAPSPRVDQEEACRITRLMEMIHQSRPDLRASFSLASRSGRRAFHAWFLENGERECRAPRASLEAALGRPFNGKGLQANGLVKMAKPFARLLPAPVTRALKSWLIRNSR